MTEPPNEHQKLLQNIDRLLAEAPDEASRRELQEMRAKLNSPDMVNMARELQSHKPRGGGDLALEFHDPLLPVAVTATGSVGAAAVCLFALLQGFERPDIAFGEQAINVWLVAALAGALSVVFTALSFVRPFSLRFDSTGMSSRVSGARWRHLRVGALQWQDLRAMSERKADRILEVRAANGAFLEIPMGVANYPILQHHLENVVRLYGS